MVGNCNICTIAHHNEIKIAIHKGRVAIASIDLDSNQPLIIASIHAPIINNRVFPHLSDIFTELESHLNSSSMIVGGDLNSARLAEKVWPGYGHGPFFEHIDKADTWIDCCRRFHPNEIQTFFRANSVNPFQDDHIFVSCDLSANISSCSVMNNDVTSKVSDHIPLIVELDI